MKNTGNEIAKLAQAANRLTVRLMREEGLGSAEAEMIQLVREQPGISQKDICAKLNMDKGAVARRAVNLEQKGYLTRKENPADGRSQLVYPSEKADSLKNSGNAAEELFYEWLLEAFSEKERESFCEMLDILSQKAEQESRDGYPNVCERMQRPALGLERRAMHNRNISGIKSDAEQEENSSDSGREAPAREKRREPDVWLL